MYTTSVIDIVLVSLFVTYFTPFYSASVANFQHVNVYWEKETRIKPALISNPLLKEYSHNQWEHDSSNDCSNWDQLVAVSWKLRSHLALNREK